MKKAEKVQKTAELSQQKLPSASAVTAGPTAAPALSASATAESQRVAGATSIDQIDGTAAAGSHGLSASSGDEARLNALERTQDLVAMHALRLSQSGNDSLRVVIEPGGGTRLSLELRFGANGIEAQALLHRGDFQFLSSHWAELQQRLEPRGVHLGALGCSQQSHSGQQRFQQSQRQAGEEQPTRSAFAEFALDGEMADSAAARRARTKTHAGWESWA